MKSKSVPSYLKKLLIVSALLIVAESVFTYAGGPPSGHTNAPGDANCTACHSGSPISSGSVWSGISLVRNGTGGISGAQPNASNSMTLSFTSSTSTTFGFQLCVLPTSATGSTASLGSLGIGSSSEIQTVTSSSPSRVYLEHTSSGNSASTGSKSWNFTWQTPASYTGGAVFYVALNEANGDNSNSGDNIYVKTFSANVLPVRWLDFAANATDLGVRINWSTAQEIRNSHFDIEKSNDGENYVSIGMLKGKLKSESITHYSFLDQQIPATSVFYRIKQVDIDGTIEYSKTIAFDPGHSVEPELKMNAGNESLYISHYENVKEIRIMGLNGQVVQTYSQISGSNLPLEKLQNGLYLIEILGNEGSQWMKKILIQ